MTSVQDILLVTVILFVTALTVAFVVFASHSINSELVQVPIVNTSAANVLASADAAIDMSDYLYLAGFIGFFISIIVFAWFVGGYPIAAPIYFVIVCIFTFVAIILQGVWGDVVLQAPYLITPLPITHFIMSNIAYFTAVFGLVAILIMYGKPSESM